MLEEGVGNKGVGVPVLLVFNKKDLIKPGEIANKLEVLSIRKIERVLLCAFVNMLMVLIFLDDSFDGGIKNSLTSMMLYLYSLHPEI
jgi:hypothetical protein